MSETTKTDNELIAEFMGIQPSGFVRGDDLDPRYKKGEFVQTGWGGLHRSELKYHESWDQLMPVVEKISSLGCKVEINIEMNHMIQGQCNIHKCDDDFYGVNGLTVLQATYDCVVSFIKVHNSQKP